MGVLGPDRDDFGVDRGDFPVLVVERLDGVLVTDTRDLAPADGGEGATLGGAAVDGVRVAQRPAEGPRRLTRHQKVVGLVEDDRDLGDLFVVIPEVPVDELCLHHRLEVVDDLDRPIRLQDDFDVRHEWPPRVPSHASPVPGRDEGESAAACLSSVRVGTNAEATVRRGGGGCQEARSAA